MLITSLRGISGRLASVAASATALWQRVPSQCALCRRWPAERICADCTAHFFSNTHRCLTCAIPVPEGVSHCGECLRHPPMLDACIAAVDYAYPWSTLITQFKFQHDPGWAAPLAELLLRAPNAKALLTHADVILPIPLSRQRLAERGFNQALLLARHMGASGKLRPDLLLRTRHTEAQSSLRREQRLRNLDSAFEIHPRKRSTLHNRRVLLIDDVMTTGATLHCTAQRVRAAGAREVSALVLARTT